MQTFPSGLVLKQQGVQFREKKNKKKLINETKPEDTTHFVHVAPNLHSRQKNSDNFSARKCSKQLNGQSKTGCFFQTML